MKVRNEHDGIRWTSVAFALGAPNVTGDCEGDLEFKPFARRNRRHFANPAAGADRMAGSVARRTVLSHKHASRQTAMMNADEPLFDSDNTTDPNVTLNPAVRERIQRLVEEQPYAVLCVQGGGQPYGALVAVAFSEDLRHAVFATPIATRKYRLLSECDHVALVVEAPTSITGPSYWLLGIRI